MAATSTRERVLSEALACFLDAGYESTTVARILDRSGVSNGALFHHFSSKEAIADALYVEAIESFQAGLWALLAGRPQTLRSAIHGTILHQLQWTEDHRDLARFVYMRGHLEWTSFGAEAVSSLNRDLAHALRAWLEPFRERGQIKPTTMVMISAIVSGPAHTIAQRWLAGQVQGPLLGFADELADAAVAGLTARVAGPENSEPNKESLTMSYETIIWEQAGGVGRLTLNRPETLNAWTAEFGSELLTVLEHEAAADDIRAILITGAGRGFSSGADLKAGFEPADDGMPDIARELNEIYHPVITGLRNLPKPVVAAVNGPAVGIGCSLALACDLVLAAESAYFGLAFVNIGLMPDGGSTALVPAAVGKARAFALALLGERVSSAEALEWGLVNAVHADGELMEAAEELVARLASGPTRSYASSKIALNRFIYGDLKSQLALEAELQHQLGRTHDFLEGAAAFVEKRKPDFTGA